MTIYLTVNHRPMYITHVCNTQIHDKHVHVYTYTVEQTNAVFGIVSTNLTFSNGSCYLILQ